jgi:hypothetical protein
MFHVSFSGLIWKRSTSPTSGSRPRHQVVKMRMPGACFQSSWCSKRTPLDHGKLGQTLGPESDKYPNMNRNIEMTNWLCLGYDGWHVDFGATDFFRTLDAIGLRRNGQLGGDWIRATRCYRWHCNTSGITRNQYQGNTILKTILELHDGRVFRISLYSRVNTTVYCRFSLTLGHDFSQSKPANSTAKTLCRPCPIGDGLNMNVHLNVLEHWMDSLMVATCRVATRSLGLLNSLFKSFWGGQNPHHPMLSRNFPSKARRKYA